MVAARSALRSIFAISIACSLTFGAVTPAAAEIVEDLYRGEAIVTGRKSAEERVRGLREALLQVLIKVSGDARLAADRTAVEPILARAEALVDRVDYEDRQAGRPIRDEQGTRDRSYYLHAAFEPAAILEALTSLGRTPWPADRPRVLVLLAIQDTIGSYLLGTRSERGYGQREALRTLAKRRSIPVVLPRMSEDDKARLSLQDVFTNNQISLQAMRAAYASDVVLSAIMRKDDDGTLQTIWNLHEGTTAISWHAHHDEFDRAIAEGLEHAALWLSGNK